MGRNDNKSEARKSMNRSKGTVAITGFDRSYFEVVTKRLIRLMAEAKDSHIFWADKQRKRRSRGWKPVPHVGSETFHRRWVRIYIEVIAALKDLEMLTC